MIGIPHHSDFDAESVRESIEKPHPHLASEPEAALLPNAMVQTLIQSSFNRHLILDLPDGETASTPPWTAKEDLFIGS